MKLDLNLETSLKNNKVTEADFGRFVELVNAIKSETFSDSELFERLNDVKFLEILQAYFDSFVEFAKPFALTLEEVSKLQMQTRNKLLSLLQERYKIVGKILSNHLLVEHLIDTFLIESKGASVLRKNHKRITFSEKINLLNLNDSYADFGKALLNINKIRNELAHNLKYDIKNLDTQSIDKFLKSINTIGLEELTVSGKVEKLTEFSILYFGLQSKEIKDKIENINSFYKQEGGVLKRTGRSYKKTQSEVSLWL